MTHATRDVIEHARDALDNLTTNWEAVDYEISSADLKLGIVARDELQKLLDDDPYEPKSVMHGDQGPT